MKFSIYHVAVFANCLCLIESQGIFKMLSSANSYIHNWSVYLTKGPDIIKDTENLVKQQGYPFETHTITTKDGYIIDLHRIPGNSGTNISIPVLLYHGCFGSSALWVVNRPDQSLGFLLSDKGHDVWMSNVRGNKYGRRHTTLNPDKSEFWKYSWDSMALIDMPTIIDFILQNTGYGKLDLVAHSLGAAQAFALLSTNKQYNDKVKHIYALAPEVNFTDVRSFFANAFAKLHPLEMGILEKLNIYEVDIAMQINRKTLGIVPKTISVLIANYAALSIFGITFRDMNNTRYPLIASHLLSGTSLYVVGQLLQVIKTNRFSSYDWGEQMNIVKYGQSSPPDYNISKVETPVTLFYAENDAVVSVGSVDDLERTLPNVAGKYAFGSKHFNHLDFLTSTKTEDYDKLLGMISS